MDFLSKTRRWIWGLVAEAISLSASLMTAEPGKPRRGISMLDWPEANQTSPTRMSESVIVVVLPWMVRVSGPPADSGAR